VSEQTFTPAPLVPDRRLMKQPMPWRVAMNDPERCRYARDLVRAAGMRATGRPSDDALLLAYERLARRQAAGGNERV
jgi:hypothetical protein